ncbi:DNA repair protein RecO [Lottiidibacillus patelloidae]|uniref:DNA repair protein RecO n=1 Tax=Lottiidibacillus patelloidae TaxID=2670334 RepID=A0A263BVI7_9BACI|nr:DNA repair protein RecO [Lottiidibacillus patelloidae]OZM57734.1 DNA repair protein RecO [Lottiidibacillus patelloidae]
MMLKAEGIVIRSIDYGESNKIITLFTKEFGKVGVMARGAKKPKSRLASTTQLFTCGYFLFQKSTKLGTLQQAEVLTPLRMIQSDIIKTAYAAYFVELLDKCTEERKSSTAIYEFLYYSLVYLNEGIDEQVLKYIFEMKMLILLGIQPHVNGCKSCGVLDEKYSFSIKEGGFLCKRCSRIDPRTLHISEQTAKLLRVFYYIDMKRLGNVSVKQETKDELEKVISNYYEEYSGLYLKSKKFLNHLHSF